MERFEKHNDIERIGVTGQMHGILYLDKLGNPISPLFTWQDGRGDERLESGETYAEKASNLTGCAAATGFGLVTHYYNMKNGLVPENTSVICTIHDYIAMLLAGKTTPVTDSGDGASMGFFNVEQGKFNTEALEALGIDEAILPRVVNAEQIGVYSGKVKVYAAIGDNQASFFGAAKGNTDCMLVNIGTGSQFSVYSQKYMQCNGLETRPFPTGGYLLVGSSLCGGRAYAMLEGFYRSVGEMLGVNTDNAYDAMAAMLSSTEKPSNIPQISTLF